MRRRNRSPEVCSGINVTPLVDVVLVLLIIFMVIAPQLHSEATVDLPETDRPRDKPDDGKQIVVVVEPGGAVSVEGERTTGETFSDRLLAAASSQGDWKVVVKADASLTFGQVRQVIFAIENAGFADVGLIAERRQDG